MQILLGKSTRLIQFVVVVLALEELHARGRRGPLTAGSAACIAHAGLRQISISTEGVLLVERQRQFCVGRDLVDLIKVFLQLERLVTPRDFLLKIHIKRHLLLLQILIVVDLLILIKQSRVSL